MIAQQKKDDIIKYVVNLIDDNQVVNITTIAEKFDVSWTSVQRYINNAGIIIPDNLKGTGGKDKKSTLTFKVDPRFVIESRESLYKDGYPGYRKEEKKEEIKFYGYSVRVSVVSATLMSNRHDMNENKNKLYIYNGPLPNYRIHDYDYLYDEAKKFIRNNVIIVGAKKLKVYTTGLVQANAAIIKASVDAKIALSFMNYDNTEHNYKEQVIIPGEEEVSETSLNSLLYSYASTKRSYNIKLVNHLPHYFNNVKSFYVVKTEETNSIGRGGEIYICDNRADMFKMYQAQIESHIDDDTSIRVMAEEITWNPLVEGEFKFGYSFGIFQNK